MRRSLALLVAVLCFAVSGAIVQSASAGNGNGNAYAWGHISHPAMPPAKVAHKQHNKNPQAPKGGGKGGTCSSNCGSAQEPAGSSDSSYAVVAQTSGAFTCNSQWQIEPTSWADSSDAQAQIDGGDWLPIAEKTLVTKTYIGNGYYLFCNGNQTFVKPFMPSTTLIGSVQVMNLVDSVGIYLGPDRGLQNTAGVYPVGI